MAPERLRDVGVAARAIVSNLAARFVPALYFHQADVTGRGLTSDESSKEVADYCRRCFDDYFAQLGVTDPSAFLNGKTILEYGPGDLPGATLLMLAHGAERAVCVDRFALVRLSEKNVKVVELLLEGCTPDQRRRLRACFVDPDRPSAGLAADKVRYIVGPSGLSGRVGDVDFAFSRAVLEHVNDLPATFEDMARALKPGALALHQVDLRSHGHHHRNALDFLRWSPAMWQVMHSAKGVPNRHRLDTYRDIVGGLPVDLRFMTTTIRASADEVRAVRPLLAAPFRGLSDDDLACLGFWVAFTRRPSADASGPA